MPSCKAVVRAEYSSPDAIIFANFRITERIFAAPLPFFMAGIIEEAGMVVV